jgi:cathepsin X
MKNSHLAVTLFFALLAVTLQASKAPGLSTFNQGHKRSSDHIPDKIKTIIP